MAQHAVFWAGATTIFLVYGRAGTASRYPLSFALGLTCLAVVVAARLAGSDDKRRRFVRPLYFAMAVLVLGLLSLHGAYVWSVGGLHAQAIEAILQTDLAEAAGYLTTRLLFLWALLWATAVAVFGLTFPAPLSELNQWRWTQGLLLIAGVVFLVLGRPVITEPLEVVVSYREGTRQLQRAVTEWNSRPQAPIASTFRGTVIVVIGESTSRHHMSVYGYPRETTPKLSALSGELAVFEDAISNHSGTIESVLNALTVPSNSPGANMASDTVGVMQLANAAGFETVWLSNQNEFGVWDNPVRILAQQADRVRFHDTALGKLSARSVFDEAMLSSLDEALGNKGPERKLIVLHLMSTHLPYCWTKPPDFNPLDEDFGKRLYGQQDSLLPRLKRFVTRRSRDLDCYDNGVRYVDALLDAIISRARGTGDPAAILYFSDHGDAPLLATGHDAAEHSAYHLEIPFILWANQAYRSAYPLQWEAATANRRQPFSLTLMPATLLDLLQLETGYLRPDDSILNADFRPRRRFALGGRIRYDSQWRENDYRENTRVFVRQLGDARGRVWSHRVNSLGALLEAKRLFAGIEMDVHFDRKTRQFQVRHNYAHIGLTLRDMLEWSRDRPELKIWLDWKQADPGDLAAALSELAALDREFALKGRMLVETGSTATSPALAAISAAGYRHGYYLPQELIETALQEGEGATARVVRQLKQVILRGKFEAITYDAALQPFVATHLDMFLTERGVLRYSWDTTVDSGSASTDPDEVAASVRERRLEALLIRFPSDFWM